MYKYWHAVSCSGVSTSNPWFTFDTYLHINNTYTFNDTSSFNVNKPCPLLQTWPGHKIHQAWMNHCSVPFSELEHTTKSGGMHEFEYTSCLATLPLLEEKAIPSETPVWAHPTTHEGRMYAVCVTANDTRRLKSWIFDLSSIPIHCCVYLCLCRKQDNRKLYCYKSVLPIVYW